MSSLLGDQSRILAAKSLGRRTSPSFFGGRSRMLPPKAGVNWFGLFGKNVLAPLARDMAYAIAPVTGEALSVRDAVRAGEQFQRGVINRSPHDMTVGALDYAAAGLGTLPVVGYGPRAAKALSRLPGKFYSKLMETVAEAPQSKMRPREWAGFLGKPERAKPSELEAVNLDEILRSREKETLGPLFERVGIEPPPMTRGELLDRLDVNQIRVDEVPLGGPGEAQTRWGHYQRVAGGEDYRELMLTIPSGNADLVEELRLLKSKRDRLELTGVTGGRVPLERWAPGATNRLWNEPQLERVAEDTKNLKIKIDRRISAIEDELGLFKGGHYGSAAPNVVVHTRFDTRSTQGGGKQLFIHEFQSDWHKALHRGDDVPSHPFEKTYDELAIKRMVKYAIDNGYDEIAWPSGHVKAGQSGYRPGDSKYKGFVDMYDKRFSQVIRKLGGKKGGDLVKADDTPIRYEVYDPHNDNVIEGGFDTEEAAYDYAADERPNYNVKEKYTVNAYDGDVIGEFDNSADAENFASERTGHPVEFTPESAPEWEIVDEANRVVEGGWDHGNLRDAEMFLSQDTSGEALRIRLNESPRGWTVEDPKH